MIEIVLVAAALASSPYRPLPGDPMAAQPALARERLPTAAPTAKGAPCRAGEGIADLPFSRGKRFCSLAAYLTHLERQGAVGLPWWRQTRPGVFERVDGRAGVTREVRTRAELMKRFGFTR